jgi:hypothetical protein
MKRNEKKRWKRLGKYEEGKRKGTEIDEKQTEQIKLLSHSLV